MTKISDELQQLINQNADETFETEKRLLKLKKQRTLLNRLQVFHLTREEEIILARKASTNLAK